jgi:hypothetical protein
MTHVQPTCRYEVCGDRAVSFDPAGPVCAYHMPAECTRCGRPDLIGFEVLSGREVCQACMLLEHGPDMCDYDCSHLEAM